MPDYAEIYATRAADYHRLVAAEDAAGAVSAWLDSELSRAGLTRAGLTDAASATHAGLTRATSASDLAPHGLSAADEVLDVGAGTGRVTALLARLSPARLVATDGAAAMLDELRATWPPALGPTPETVVADYRALPFSDQRFAAVSAGWALGHLTGFHPDTWPEEADQALSELERVARPGAPLLLLETLGTGSPTPAAPRDSLAALYARFEARGYQRTVLRTDYRFASRALAEDLVGFFFGPTKLAALRDSGDGVTLIEWTGAWSKQR